MSHFVSDRAYDYFDLGDESDQESAESSEDEIDIILRGTPEQRRRLCQSHTKEQRQRAGQNPRQAKHLQLTDGHQSSSEDEFEKEMNAELDKTVSMLEKSRGSRPAPGPSAHSSTTADTDKKKQQGGDNSASQSTPAFYNDIYFDSDDDENYEGEGDRRVQKHHTKLSNDDLLYDPDMDDEDQRWVDQQRRRQHGGGKELPSPGQRGGKKRAAPKSDAVLDCPACMTTLCRDCQRHDIYPNQFRAMFVMNCKVNQAEMLSVPEQAAKKKAKKSKKSKSEAKGSQDGGNQMEADVSSSSSSSSDQFHPVLCEQCDTVVGVVDLEEVYHFFNVLVRQA